MILLAACSPQVANEPAVTSAALQTTPFVRPTLPPTWTPTFTPTLEPPTATRTATPTPTETPTASPEDICRTFFAVTNLTAANGTASTVYVNQGSIISIIVSTDSADDTVHFAAVHRLTGKSNGTDIPGGTLLSIGFPVKDLPQPGQYDWSLSVISPAFGELCKQTGTFLVIGRESTRPEENTIR